MSSATRSGRARAESIELPSGLKNWVMLQVSRGQEYYSTRLQRLGLRGGKVLDAGCGMGNWSICLARWFDEVHALELDQVRLAVLERMCDAFSGRIRTRTGSIENLPYDADTFDAVFCNGVIFLTDVEHSLREFARVLKPDGVLYFTFNSKAWWLHLIFDRGPAEPECLEFGCNGILDLCGFEASIASRSKIGYRRRNSGVLGDLLLSGTQARPLGCAAAAGGLTRHLPDTSPTGDTLDHFDAELIRSTREVLRACFDGSDLAPMVPELLQMLEVLERHALPAHKRRMLRDLGARLLFGRAEFKLEFNTRSFEPEEISTLLGRIGFRRVC